MRAQQFTHFFSLPFRHNQLHIRSMQQQLIEQAHDKTVLRPFSPKQMHLTLAMLSLPPKHQQLIKTMVNDKRQEISKLVRSLGKIQFSGPKFFKGPKSRGKLNIKVIYLEPNFTPEQKIIFSSLSDLLVRHSLNNQIITQDMLSEKSMHIVYDHRTNKFTPTQPHITMFRVDRQSDVEWDFLQKIQWRNQMQAQSLDVSTRFDYDQDGFYKPLIRIQ